MIIRIGRPPRSFEAPFVITHFEVDEFVSYSTAMDLTNAVNGACIRRCRDAHSRVSMLFARESNASAVDCITANQVKYFGILFAG